jgi:hypothetical protein
VAEKSLREWFNQKVSKNKTLNYTREMKFLLLMLRLIFWMSLSVHWMLLIQALKQSIKSRIEFEETIRSAFHFQR